MNKEYNDYLASPEWKSKRNHLIALAKRRCESCGSKKKIQVHHLTYARIFNEDIHDLIVLCHKHHELIEKLYDAGEITKTGDVVNLRAQTHKLLRSESLKKPKAKPPRKKKDARVKKPVTPIDSPFPTGNRRASFIPQPEHFKLLENQQFRFVLTSLLCLSKFNKWVKKKIGMEAVPHALELFKAVRYRNYKLPKSASNPPGNSD